MLGFTEDEMIKEPIEAKDFKVLCDEEFNMQTYNAVIPIHKCETTNLPRQSKWSFYMINDSTYDVANNIPKEKRRKTYMAHFLLEKVSYQIQGSCVPGKCHKLEKNINKILSTLNY